MSNRNPLNYFKSRCLPANTCLFCGKRLFTFRPEKRTRLRDAQSNILVGWECKPSCAINLDEDEPFDSKF